MMRRILLIVLLTTAVPAAAQPAPARPVERDALRGEAVQILSGCIRINPPVALSHQRVLWSRPYC